MKNLIHHLVTLGLCMGALGGFAFLFLQYDQVDAAIGMFTGGPPIDGVSAMDYAQIQQGAKEASSRRPIAWWLLTNRHTVVATFIGVGLLSLLEAIRARRPRDREPVDPSAVAVLGDDEPVPGSEEAL